MCCSSAQADTIIGVFSNPVLAGTVADDPTIGQNTYFDNTGTAVSFIDNVNNPVTGGTPPQQQFGNFVLWGSGADSEIDFFGALIPPDPTAPFQIGTLTFNNGFSNLNQLVFGFTLSFYDTAVGPGSFLGSDQIIITTTQDLSGSAPGDDDYLNICGPSSSICGKSIEAAEASEGGTGVTVNLIGTITGDPMLSLTDVNLAAGQTGPLNGFIGSDPAIGALTPEPGTWIMLALGLTGLGLISRLKSSRSNRQAAGR
jgi:hypothetical protein